MDPSITPAAEEGDFFSAPVAPAPAAGAPAAAAAVTAASTACLQPGLHTKVKPYHVAAGIFVLAAVVLFGNPFGGTSNEQDDPSAGALMTTPRYVAGAEGTGPAATAVAAPMSPSSGVRDATPAPQQPPQLAAAAQPGAPASLPASAAAAVPPSALAEKTVVDELAALRTQLAAMQSELVGLRADHAAARSTPPGAPRPRVAATAERFRPGVTARSAPERRAESADRGVLTGYRINTIYPGQAWIEVGQRTFLVEPGTVVDGMRVTRIDPVARRVQTTQGDIL
ncbi:hypothetical protein [Azohydromonas australica]|uniref:hypothetical protein n=1 Tax=Azohydromonas australica TaxID=364039 RepID=UPI0012EC0086|nr:hypothetical protein [Azohydromonas australica]